MEVDQVGTSRVLAGLCPFPEAGLFLPGFALTGSVLAACNPAYASVFKSRPLLPLPA